MVHVAVSVLLVVHLSILYFHLFIVYFLVVSYEYSLLQ